MIYTGTQGPWRTPAFRKDDEVGDVARAIPRVRGERRVRRLAPRQPRAIPTCAGRTELDETTAQVLTGHPRVCGENGGTGNRFTLFCGPSPRVRGEHLRSFSRASSRSGPSPRVRGELTPDGIHGAEVNGPSPRVRGEPCPSRPAASAWPGHPRVCGENAADDLQVVGVIRAIPACAGRTDFPGQAEPR